MCRWWRPCARIFWYLRSADRDDRARALKHHYPGFSPPKSFFFFFPLLLLFFFYCPRVTCAHPRRDFALRPFMRWSDEKRNVARVTSEILIKCTTFNARERERKKGRGGAWFRCFVILFYFPFHLIKFKYERSDTLYSAARSWYSEKKNYETLRFYGLIAGFL